MSTGVKPKSHPRNREEEDLIAELYSYINKLKADIKVLEEKNKSLTEKLEKKNREITNLKKDIIRRRTSGAVVSVNASARYKPEPPPLPEITLQPGHTTLETKPAAAQKRAEEPSGLLELAKSLKIRYVLRLIDIIVSNTFGRLAAAEDQLNLAREENAKLRGDILAGVGMGGHTRTSTITHVLQIS